MKFSQVVKPKRYKRRPKKKWSDVFYDKHGIGRRFPMVGSKIDFKAKGIVDIPQTGPKPSNQSQPRIGPRRYKPTYSWNMNPYSGGWKLYDYFGLGDKSLNFDKSNPLLDSWWASQYNYGSGYTPATDWLLGRQNRNLKPGTNLQSTMQTGRQNRNMGPPTLGGSKP